MMPTMDHGYDHVTIVWQTVPDRPGLHHFQAHG